VSKDPHIYECLNMLPRILLCELFFLQSNIVLFCFENNLIDNVFKLFDELINISQNVILLIIRCPSFKKLPLVLVLALLSLEYLTLFLDFLVDDEFPDHVDNSKVDVPDVFLVQITGYLIEVIVELTNLLTHFVINFS